MHLNESSTDNVPMQIVQLGIQDSEVGKVNLDRANGRSFASLVVSMRASHFHFSYQIGAASHSLC